LRLPSPSKTVFILVLLSAPLAYKLYTLGYSPLFSALYAPAIVLSFSAASVTIVAVTKGRYAEYCRAVGIAALVAIALTGLLLWSFESWIVARCWSPSEEKAVACVAESTSSIFTPSSDLATKVVPPVVPPWLAPAMLYPSCLAYSSFIVATLRLMNIPSELVWLAGAGHVVVVANASGRMLVVDPRIGPAPIIAGLYASLSHIEIVKALGIETGNDYTQTLGYRTGVLRIVLGDHRCVEIEKVGARYPVKVCGKGELIIVVAAGDYRIENETVVVRPGRVATANIAPGYR